MGWNHENAISAYYLNLCNIFSARGTGNMEAEQGSLVERAPKLRKRALPAKPIRKRRIRFAACENAEFGS